MIFGVLTRVIPIPARSGDRLPPHPACPVFELQNDLTGTMLNIPAHSLYFRCYAAAFSQARRMAGTSSSVGWPGQDARNFAAMRTRRSLASISAVDGWDLVAYQGARAR